MRPFVLVLLALATLGLAACASTPEDRGQWHEYLHQHGWE